MSKRKYNYRIPAPYYRPCMYALELFRKGGYDLGTAINITYNSFTNPKVPDHIKITHKGLRSHLLNWLRVNSDYRRFRL